MAGAGRPAEAALARLRELERRGADVALVAPRAPAGSEIPLQRIAHVGPLPVIRALEAEMHVRPIDTVLAFGPRARAVVRVLPAGFRPQLAELERELAPT